MLLLVAGCANRQPTVSELKIDSNRAVNAAATSSSSLPFCLHIKYSNEYKYVLTENNAQAWVTDGSCDADGPQRNVAELVVRWRYQHDQLGTRSCTAAAECSLNEQTYGEGRRLSCVSGSARDGGFEAGVSTDWYACPK